MRILLDTHILFWLLYDSKRLRKSTLKVLAASEKTFVSSATIWEIAIKVRIRKMDADIDKVIREVERRSLQSLPITFAHARQVAELDLRHKDPFDRLLIAQAITEGMHLLTADPQLKPYSDLVICV